MPGGNIPGGTIPGPDIAECGPNKICFSCCFCWSNICALSFSNITGRTSIVPADTATHIALLLNEKLHCMAFHEKDPALQTAYKHS